MKMPQCPRCSAKLKRITPNHINACAIPIPKYLAQSFIDEPCTTTKELAHKFDVHRDFMVRRLELGGIPTGIQANRGYFLRRLHWGSIKEERPKIPTGMKLCCDCGILILDIETICKECIARRQRALTT